jgi:hypothetical protein
MNCQEVMDYMQRQLDGDLDERETDILMTHTRHCPECNLMFERLKLLSSGLESLPKVTPSYSLVDAILPRLAGIQASGTSEPEAEAEAEVVAAPMPSRRAVAERKWPSRLALGLFGGVVAAGIAVGMLLLNEGGGAVNDSGQMTASSADSTAAGSAANESAAGGAADKSAEDSAASPKANYAPAETDALHSSSNKKLASSGGSSDARKDAADARGGSDADGGAKPSASEPSEDTSHSYSPNYETTYTANVQGTADSSGSVEQKKSADGGGSSEGAGVSDKILAGQDAVNGLTDNKTNTKQQTSSASAGNEANASSSDLSPDGKLKAVVQDFVLRVYTVKDETLLFESRRHAAGIRSIVWAKDGGSLTYTTAAADGTIQVYIVKPKDGTEQLAAK